MALLFPAVGESLVLNAILNKVAGQDQTLKLFKSNTTPANSDVAGTYTECTFTGYSSKSLTAANWTVTNGNPSSAAYGSAQQFTYSGSVASDTVYGYYVIQAGSGTLLYAERDAAPFTVSTNGDIYQVTPAMTCT